MAARRAPLILVAEPQLVSSGLWPDRHPIQSPLWERAVNTRFAGGKVQRRIPNSPMFTAGANPIRGIGQHQNSGGTRWVWAASGGQIVRWFGPAPENIGTPLAFQRDQTGSTEATFFDFNPWGNWMLVNSRNNGIRRYDPAGPTFAVLPNAPTDAVQFLKKRNQLLAIGYGLNSHYVAASDADDITNWDFTATDNLAVELPLEELDTPVKAACHFGTSVAVFGENQMFAINWVGSPFYWGQQKLLDGIGAIGKKAVCADGRLIYGVGRNGVWKTDGTAYSYIDEVVLRDYLQENVNWAQGSKVVAEKNDVSGCIEFSFPTGSSLDPNEAWAYDPRYGGWSKVPAFSDMARRVLFDKPLQGQTNGHMELMEDFPETTADLDLETKGLLIQRDAQALHIGAIVDEIELFVHAALNVEFRYGVSESPDGPYHWSGWMPVDAKQSLNKLLPAVSGVYHKLGFKNYESNWKLDLQGFALFGEAEGLRRERS